MTDITTPLRTLPPRSLAKGKPRWARGDALTVNGVRWIIRHIVDDLVILVAANTTNHGVLWNTTLDHLPEKAA